MLKLLPRGPLQLVASATSPLATVNTVADWAAGRSLEQEEQRLGMLCRIRTLQQEGASSASHHKASAAALVRSSFRPLTCVAKCDIADWQVNELDSDGSTIFLNRRPKPQWKKKHKRQTFMVEDNSDESFSNPSKTFTPRVQHQGAYARRLGKISAERPLVAFTVYRENTSVDAMKNRLQSEGRIDPDALELFDSTSRQTFGCITQRGFGVGVSPEALVHGSRHYSLHSLLLDPDTHMYPLDQLAELRRPPAGTHFRVLLRCVDAKDRGEINALMIHLAVNGFVNYFDVSRFGIGGSSLHEISACLHHGDFHRACAMWLQGEAEKNSVHYSNFLAYIKAEVSATQGVVGVWRNNAFKYNSSKRMLNFLEQLQALSASTPSGCSLEEGLERLAKTAFPSIDEYDNSAAEFVWNAMASQRLITYGMRVVVGDLVQVRRHDDENNNTMNEGGSDCCLVVSSTEMASKYSIFDVVLPVMYSSSVAGSTPIENKGGGDGETYFPTHSVGESFCRDFCQLHRLDFLMSGSEPSRSTPTDHVQKKKPRHSWYLRPVVARVQGLRHIAVVDPNSYSAVKSDLFMLQERLAPRTTTDLHERLREPCVFNVSEAFVEKMKPILAARSLAKGSSENGVRQRFSVMVSGVVPQGSHMSVALREVFDVSHATFHDLLR